MKKVCLITAFFAFFLSSTFAQNQSIADSIKRVVEQGEVQGEEKLKAYYWLSSYSSSPDNILKYGQTLLDLAKDAKNQKYTLRAYYCIGIGHRLMGNLGEALEYQFKCANETKDDEEYLPFLVEVYTEISTIYTQNGDSENALLYGSKIVNILRNTDKKQELALTLLNYGFDYYVIGNYDSAMAYYN